MKKYLFIILSLFSFVFINDNVYALSYTVNGNTYQVTDIESLRDYCYYTNSDIKTFNKNLIVAREYTVNNNGRYYCISSNSSYYTYFYTYYNPQWNMPYIHFSKTKPNITTSGFNIMSKIFTTNFEYSTYDTNKDLGVSEIYYSNYDIYNYDTNNNNIANSIYFNSNYSFTSIENKYAGIVNKYTITYYLNNQVYQVISDIEEGSSHTLLYYEPSNEYNFSGWSYDNNIDLTNITSNVNIYGTTSLKPYYTITYYLNNSVYDTISVMEGTNYTLASYVPPRNYTFSGWTYDNNIDLTNITSNVDIFGTTTYVRPSINYSENIDSVIHNISYQILGNSIPIEFDFCYTIMDFIILIIIICCVIAPFLILIKLLGGRF